jgi:V/A-type H+-transporting ATPase subunit F
MKMYLISDNIDTQTGMRLAGVEGVVVHGYDETIKALDEALQYRDIGVLMITEKLGSLVAERINDIKINYHTPLIVEVPDRHGTGRTADSITQYVRDAIGLKI